jgi:DNA processing protein
MNENTPAVRDLKIALSLLPFLTPNRTRLLLEYFQPVSAVCNASSSLIQGLLSVTPAQADQVRNPLTPAVRERIETLRDQVLVPGDDAYPSLLATIIDPPLALHYRGDASLLARPAIAIVGSRKATPYAVNAAEQLARDLISAGITIVSGLAVGVDSAAHRAALEAGGSTIAVLGTGIDVVYPRSSARLFREIEERGLLVTELPPATPPRQFHFPMRNRLISGLSLGTVIVEASTKSGSLITATMAAEQGREVFAVPGSIFSTNSEGTHRLIQYGAKLVHDAQDVLDELRGDFKLPGKAQTEPESPLQEVLAALTREDATHVDTIAEKLKCTPATLAEALLTLELTGWIRATPGARYVRVR